MDMSSPTESEPQTVDVFVFGVVGGVRASADVIPRPEREREIVTDGAFAIGQEYKGASLQSYIL